MEKMKMKEFMERMSLVRVSWLSVAVVLFFVFPLFASEAWISLVTEMIIMALAACALNLMLGYTGMVSFGPAGLYAVGAYTTAILLKKAGAPFAIAMAAGPVVAGFVGIIVGWLCVRRTAVYFALLTLAFAQIIWTIIFAWYGFTGGDDGIVGFRIPDLLKSISSSYYFSLIMVIICLLLLWIIVNSPFGKTLQAIRENPGRAEFIGINVRRYQLYAFILSSAFLGAAGSLFAAFSGSVFPDYAHWIKSTDIIVICLLGGMYTFLGPVMGSVVYIFLSKLISGYTMYWMFFLGVVIVFLVLFMRGGIVGFISQKLSPVMQGNNEVER
jgi:branched-chain amino acid transport system permease protein